MAATVEGVEVEVVGAEVDAVVEEVVGPLVSGRGCAVSIKLIKEMNTHRKKKIFPIFFPLFRQNVKFPQLFPTLVAKCGIFPIFFPPSRQG